MNNNYLTLAVLVVASFLITSSLLAQEGKTSHRFIANQGATLFEFDETGKPVWEMKLSKAPHDLHVLNSGNLLTHQDTEVIEIDRAKKEIVWSFDVRKISKSKKIEVHSIAPLDGDKVMIAISGERKIVEIDRKGNVTHSISMSLDRPNPHRDTRLVRPLKSGGYLVAHEGDGKVREYDRSGKVVWEYEVPLFDQKPKRGHGVEAYGNALFSAIRLDNGNTLIGTGNGHRVLEVSPEKKIVWKLEQNELEGISLAWVTTLEVHADGCIVVGNCHAGEKNPQLVKINRDKKVLWQFLDFTKLGNSVSNSQILDSKASVIR